MVAERQGAMRRAEAEPKTDEKRERDFADVKKQAHPKLAAII